MSDAFHGWPEDFQRFFIGLELDNSKRYFDANRQVYERAVKAPMVALVESLADQFGPMRVYRPNRDIRFAKDKSPYKTNIGAYSTGGGTGAYVSLDARGLMVATGRYEITPEELAKYRAKVAEERTGASLAAIVDKLEKGGYKRGGEELKRVPAGYPQDHPRAHLLRHKRLFVYRGLGLQPWLGSPAARKHIVMVLTEAQPLNDWLRKHLG
jgi:uncharacterized protein (TIGR02453 family)